MIRVSVLLAPLLLLSACASSWPTGTAENGYPILPRDSIVVYETMADVPGGFKVLGVVANTTPAQPERGTPRVVSAEELERLRASGMVRKPRTSARNPEERIESAQRTAATLGANGVLVVTQADIAADERLAMLVGAPLRDGSVVMIYVRTPPEASGEGSQ